MSYTFSLPALPNRPDGLTNRIEDQDYEGYSIFERRIIRHPMTITSESPISMPPAIAPGMHADAAYDGGDEGLEAVHRLPMCGHYPVVIETHQDACCRGKGRAESRT
ncbi:MAG: hypothetical protein MZU95_11935 [Desulfomicrobium escambiense]|nr:hypothetical protein [Desulfomicrobium escambiense]